MISANELRIGNKVIRNGIHVTVDGMSIWDAQHERVQYDPIPLTPEILEKAGFKDDGAKTYAKKACLFNIDLDEHGVYIVYVGMQGIGVLKYLHQLQNLYFAIMGEELNIEL